MVPIGIYSNILENPIAWESTILTPRYTLLFLVIYMMFKPRIRKLHFLAISTHCNNNLTFVLSIMYGSYETTYRQSGSLTSMLINVLVRGYHWPNQWSRVWCLSPSSHVFFLAFQVSFLEPYTLKVLCKIMFFLFSAIILLSLSLLSAILKTPPRRLKLICVCFIRT